MSTLPPHDMPAIFWIDAAGQQQGPEPLTTVIERIAYEQIPSSTPVWWQGAANWTPFNTNAELSRALESRLAPVPAADVAAFSTTEAVSVDAGYGTTFEQASAASPFAPPADASPMTFETPATFEAPAPFDPGPTVIEAAPVVFEPAPVVFEPEGYSEPAVQAAPEVVLPAAYQPEPPAAEAQPEPALLLGDPDELRSTFAALTARSTAVAEERERAAALDETLAAAVRQGLSDIGFTIQESLTSGEYHSYRLTAPDGSSASLAIERVPAAATVAAAVEQPVSCFVDHRGRASVGLFLDDYLDEHGSTDQGLFTRHLAAIVAEADTPA